MDAPIPNTPHPDEATSSPPGRRPGDEGDVVEPPDVPVEVVPIDEFPLGFAVYHHTLGVTTVNRAWTELTGCSRPASSGTGFLDAFVADEREPVLALVEGVTAGAATVVTERRLTESHGRARWARVVLNHVDGNGSGPGCTITLDDFTVVKEREAVLTRRASRDSLTGLPNRDAILAHAARALTRASRRATTMALLFIDLDRFKEVNDRLGHRGGDEVLRGIADHFAAEVRPTDTLARFGGDEFAVVCEDLATTHDATIVAQRLLDAACRPVTVGEESVVVEASIGIAYPQADTKSVAALIVRADEAMYRAKHLGGSCWRASG